VSYLGTVRGFLRLITNSNFRRLLLLHMAQLFVDDGSAGRERRDRFIVATGENAERSALFVITWPKCRRYFALSMIAGTAP